MENPAYWNETTKILNKHLYIGVTLEKIISVLVDNNLLLFSPTDLKVINAIQSALDKDQWEHDNIACGNSIGLKVYNALKEINAII